MLKTRAELSKMDTKSLFSGTPENQTIRIKNANSGFYHPTRNITHKKVAFLGKIMNKKKMSGVQIYDKSERARTCMSQKMSQKMSGVQIYARNKKSVRAHLRPSK
jgi:hypothetical protein